MKQVAGKLGSLENCEARNTGFAKIDEWEIRLAFIDPLDCRNRRGVASLFAVLEFGVWGTAGVVGARWAGAAKGRGVRKPDVNRRLVESIYPSRASALA